MTATSRAPLTAEASGRASARDVTVRDLLHAPALQVRLLAGEAGLSRSVSWAHVSELADPTPWLAGAELIMTTGLALPVEGAGQRAYLERLDDAGVAALALSEGLHVPPLQAAFLDAAKERGFPVLEVPLPVPFIAVAQQVAAVRQDELGSGLGAQLQVFGALRWMAEEQLSDRELFARLERLSGYRLLLCSPGGRPLLPGVPAPDERDRHLLPGGSSSAPTVPGGFVLPVHAPGATAGFLLARARHGAHPAGLAVVQHIATVAALQVSLLRHRQETARREGAEGLAEMLASTSAPAVVQRRLQRAGFGPPCELVLVVLRPRHTHPCEAARAEAELVSRLLDAELPHLLLRQQDDLLALLPAGEQTAEVLAAGTVHCAGSSAPFPTGSPLELPRQEARWAAARAVDRGTAHLRYGEQDVAERWLPQDVAALGALVERVLGEAATYDRRRGADLLLSVATWLEHDRRTDSAARALQVHPNTLAYRLRRFGELSGRDLGRTDDLAEVWLALSARRHLEG